MPTTVLEQLTQQIEQAIREHLYASEQAAADAVVRAFAAARATRARSTPAKPQTTSSRRRPSSEINSLSENVYRVVCDRPGETMAVLAPVLGLTARELHRPMAQLKRQGKVRAIGERHLTRYFPMAAK